MQLRSHDRPWTRLEKIVCVAMTVAMASAWGSGGAMLLVAGPVIAGGIVVLVRESRRHPRAP